MFTHSRFKVMPQYWPSAMRINQLRKDSKLRQTKYAFKNF